MIHESLAAGRWQKMTLAEQMGNVGSEFERARVWKQKARPDKFEPALARFAELMDLTVSDQRWQGMRRRELARAKEESLAALIGEDLQQQSLQDYFLQFAILARAKH
ncbi:MAG: hypothetical protein A2751_03500 [Candidatus Doudnabacteria bacterium RIFCSPHIGHO2_01_FULL_46_14]|uniref:Uncharacterized protein n=1 Tax=Candidatus Doudnabacteria bacterium RIFCSPHIGHO2_01_FULL_46_14 TaxID=1817824 RepID=A0A1F5NKM4_9BACT|nr:MAG: hypothetical protein A2751_03500 [Candidatus Doudnabacteria bacterium RIFCSPHIGHO2_01_FULL_46_14]